MTKPTLNLNETERMRRRILEMRKKSELAEQSNKGSIGRLEKTQNENTYTTKVIGDIGKLNKKSVDVSASNGFNEKNV